MRPPVLRAWWAARQGLLALDGEASPAAVLGRSGWARSVGGVNPYMTLFARAGTSRATAEEAAARRQIHELPGARGCTYIVPREDFALALRVGQGFSEAAELQMARKHLGVTDPEIDRLCEGVLAALGEGAKDPAALKMSLGDTVRNLGEAGKKRGMTTTLPLALALLQSKGEILRQPVGGRLDQQRYAYTLWTDSPLRGDTRTVEEAQVELARKYFRWIGPASAAHFQWFSGLPQKAVKAAIAPLGLVPLEAGSPLLMHPEDHEALVRFEPPGDPVYRLVAGIDALFLLRRDMQDLLDPDDAARKIVGDRGAVELGGLQDLTSHAIVDRGRVIGLWEYDPEASTIAWSSFVKPTPALRAEVERTQTFIREQLGDARAFSLDSPEKRRPRIDALRQA
ncbi:MAG TPA: crosslink repair DNA glycosylase YcaQ family protein [Nannocystis sp.]